MFLATCTFTSVSSVCILTFIDILKKRYNNTNLNAQKAYITIIMYITNVMLTTEKSHLPQTLRLIILDKTLPAEFLVDFCSCTFFIRRSLLAPHYRVHRHKSEWEIMKQALHTK